MTELLKKTFAEKKARVSLKLLKSSSQPLIRIVQGAPAFITFVTAGYPTRDATVPIIQAMEAGGADIVELGVPFTDPQADGPAIQETNNVGGIPPCIASWRFILTISHTSECLPPAF